MTKDLAFEKLAEGVIYGNLGVFVGAGLPMAIMNRDGDTIALSWPQLLEKCAKLFEIDFKTLHKPGNSYPDIATKMCKAIAKRKRLSHEGALIELKQVIADLTSLYPDSPSRDEFKSYFETLGPKWIITTNYDTVVESVLTGIGHSLGPEDQLTAPIDRIPVYHLHGIRTNPSSIVITQEDYVALFRPNQYRQQKLPLTIKESVTLLIGYSLGDFNVLTALDWSKNVFTNEKATYPSEMIQLVRSSHPRKSPYYQDGILVVEFEDMATCLSEICDFVKRRKADAIQISKKLRRLELKYGDPSEKMIDEFIGDDDSRQKVLTHLKESKHHYINGFLELMTRAMDTVWKNARQTGQFHEYNKYLNMLLDIVESVDFDSAPPALVQTISYGLDKVGYYVGPNWGEAHAAYRTWLRRGPSLPRKAVKELINISKSNPNYRNLGRLLKLLGD